MTQLDLIPSATKPERQPFKIVETYRGHDIATDPSMTFGALYIVFDPNGALIAQAQVSQWSARRLIDGELLSTTH